MIIGRRRLIDKWVSGRTTSLFQLETSPFVSADLSNLVSVSLVLSSFLSVVHPYPMSLLKELLVRSKSFGTGLGVGDSTYPLPRIISSFAGRIGDMQSKWVATQSQSSCLLCSCD